MYFPEFITHDEGEALFKNIKDLDWQEIRLFKQIAKRKVVHFSLNYMYSSRKVTPTTPPPEFLHPLMIDGSIPFQQFTALDTP